MQASLQVTPVTPLILGGWGVQVFLAPSWGTLYSIGVLPVGRGSLKRERAGGERGRARIPGWSLQFIPPRGGRVEGAWTKARRAVPTGRTPPARATRGEPPQSTSGSRTPDSHQTQAVRAMARSQGTRREAARKFTEDAEGVEAQRRNKTEPARPPRAHEAGGRNSTTQRVRAQRARRQEGGSKPGSVESERRTEGRAGPAIEERRGSASLRNGEGAAFPQQTDDRAEPPGTRGWMNRTPGRRASSPRAAGDPD